MNDGVEILIIASFIIGSLVGGGIGGKMKEDLMKNEAVAHGHAEYYIDNEFNKQFRWFDGEGCNGKNTTL